MPACRWTWECRHTIKALISPCAPFGLPLSSRKLGSALSGFPAPASRLQATTLPRRHRRSTHAHTLRSTASATRTGRSTGRTGSTSGRRSAGATASGHNHVRNRLPELAQKLSDERRQRRQSRSQLLRGSLQILHRLHYTGKLRRIKPSRSSLPTRHRRHRPNRGHLVSALRWRRHRRHEITSCSREYPCPFR